MKCKIIRAVLFEYESWSGLLGRWEETRKKGTNLVRALTVAKTVGEKGGDWYSTPVFCTLMWRSNNSKYFLVSHTYSHQVGKYGHFHYFFIVKNSENMPTYSSIAECFPSTLSPQEKEKVLAFKYIKSVSKYKIREKYKVNAKRNHFPCLSSKFLITFESES